MDIKLDRSAIKALASETRVEVLKLLGSRNHMQSEIASTLNLSVPTVKEHLASLESAGLIERHDEGRKWKYFALTSKGKGILYPEQSKIWLLLGTWVFAALGGVFAGLRLFSSTIEEAPVMAAKMASPAAESLASDSMMMMQAVPVEEVAQSVPVWPYVLLGLFVIVSLILLFFVIKQKVYQSRLGKRLTKK